MTSGSSPRRLYWDACVFLHYIEQTPGHIGVLDGILAELQSRPDSRIYTSQISIVEVAHTTLERNSNHPNDEILAALDDLWFRYPLVETVEVNRMITTRARELMRDHLPNGWRLKPCDAIHLATAQWIGRARKIDEIHTYEPKWVKYQPHVGIVVCKPYVVQPPLGF